jgi:aconitate hydratase 2/2-methylisocitrate dehydratase
MADMGVLTAASDKIYQYLNFDQVQDYTDAAASVKENAAV